MTTREKLHQLVDELNKVEVEAALARLVRDRARGDHATSLAEATVNVA